MCRLPRLKRFLSVLPSTHVTTFLPLHIRPCLWLPPFVPSLSFSTDISSERYTSFSCSLSAPISREVRNKEETLLNGDSNRTERLFLETSHVFFRRVFLAPLFPGRLRPGMSDLLRVGLRMCMWEEIFVEI